MTFINLVRKHFSYLTADYDFSITESTMGVKPFSDAIVEFKTTKTLVSIQFDRSQVVVLLRPIDEPEIAKLSLEVIIGYFTQGEIETIINRYKSMDSLEKRIDADLALYANALREYCDSFLLGDFSYWLDICKFFLKKTQAMYKSLTGLELPQDERFTVYVKSKEAGT